MLCRARLLRILPAPNQHPCPKTQIQSPLREETVKICAAGGLGFGDWGLELGKICAAGGLGFGDWGLELGKICAAEGLGFRV